MGKFSEAEVNQLQENANVAYVSENEVVFTAAFKHLAWEEKQSGKNLPTIFRENGVDPKVLGHKRIENFSRRLREIARNSSSFIDRRMDNHRPDANDKELSPEDKIRRLEHELAYARQEVEFLKNCKWQTRRLGKNGNRSTGQSKVCHYC